MTAILIGASPPGSKSLHNLNIPFILIKNSREKLSKIKGNPIKVIDFPYDIYPERIIELVPILKEVDSNIECCISFTEKGVYPASLLSEDLGLKSNSPSVIKSINNKLEMRNKLDGLTIQPKFGISNQYSKFDFNTVVKPIDGSGSEGVEFVEKGKHLQNLPDSYFWEEFIEGDEYSVEVVSFNGQHHLIGITKKITTGPPNFVETIHIAPGILDENLTLKVKDFIFNALNILNVMFGPTHTEIVITKDLDIYIIETHCRPGGDNIPYLTELTTGLNQYELGIRSLLGAKSYEREGLTRVKHVAVYYPIWQPGKVNKIEGLETFETQGWIIENSIDKNIKEVKELRSSDDRNGYIILCADSNEELYKKLNLLRDKIRLDYI